MHHQIRLYRTPVQFTGQANRLNHFKVTSRTDRIMTTLWPSYDRQTYTVYRISMNLTRNTVVFMFRNDISHKGYVSIHPGMMKYQCSSGMHRTVRTNTLSQNDCIWNRPDIIDCQKRMVLQSECSVQYGLLNAIISPWVMTKRIFTDLYRTHCVRFISIVVLLWTPTNNRILWTRTNEWYSRTIMLHMKTARLYTQPTNGILAPWCFIGKPPYRTFVPSLFRLWCSYGLRPTIVYSYHVCMDVNRQMVARTIMLE